MATKEGRECKECGALVLDAAKHRRFHESLVLAPRRSTGSSPFVGRREDAPGRG